MYEEHIKEMGDRLCILLADAILSRPEIPPVEVTGPLNFTAQALGRRMVCGQKAMEQARARYEQGVEQTSGEEFFAWATDHLPLTSTSTQAAYLLACHLLGLKPTPAELALCVLVMQFLPTNESYADCAETVLACAGTLPDVEATYNWLMRSRVESVKKLSEAWLKISFPLFEAEGRLDPLMLGNRAN
jgi:hypothetical protein